ncbi:FkbM family methyltransferase [Plantactinospora sp. GCM10030261]|uniref:FkbM family methyltransferase n=1 Tax=Plantactinospora sp. GCM10030261 TaxID=3273420 RepID=UPI003618275B
MRALTNTAKVLTFVWQHPANRGGRLRAVGRAATFQLRGRLGLPTVTRIGTSASLVAELHQHGASIVVYANPPDWCEMVAWRRLLGPGALFIDVGSNVGAYALWAGETGARVIAVEPDPDAAGRLRRNIALNTMAIEVLECALADRPGELSLSVGQDSMNHLVLEGTEPSRTVPVRTLDEVIGDRDVAGVKVDVEGAERLVLEGARHALADQRIRVLQLEWNQQSERTLGEDRAPVADLLRGYGYHLMRPDEAGRLHPTEAAGYGSDMFAVADPAIGESSERVTVAHQRQSRQATAQSFDGC